MSNEQPLVSIISPTYNHARFIADCIESVLAQTYTHWEMIIIDDGSSDETFSIARKYAEKDKRIKPFTQKNIGIFRLAESYNFALKQCTGKYVAILECDDFWFPDKLEVQIDAMEKNPHCNFSWGRAFLSSIDFSSDYYLAPKNNDAISFFNNKPVGSFLNSFFHTLIPALTIVIKKDALITLGGFQQPFNLPLVDIPTTMEFLFKSEFIFIDHLLGKWRIYPNQVTKTYTVQMTSGYYQLVTSLMERYPEIFEQQNITKSKIEQHFKSRFVVSYSRSGRYKLIRKDFKGARKDYWHSITHYGLTEPVWKLRSAIGLFLSFFGLDVEWLAKLIGNKSYS